MAIPRNIDSIKNANTASIARGLPKTSPTKREYTGQFVPNSNSSTIPVTTPIANITAKTPTVVFCMTFDAKGLEVTQKKGVVTIQKEGEIAKFVEKVNSVSFSAKRAIENGQKVLYVTERCVFRLTPKGLKLIEVYPGVDMQKDILDRLPFEVEI